MTEPSPVRCVIYTRKSSEEGLDQAFNSLHAQREACEAYIRSQAGEGWVPLADHYDDGGYSGGSMDRPALRRLLEAVASKRVDAVVVYKVDRLSRSLPDFARIVEALEKDGVSFVSVTQAFNTTTSMGRLTLNVLLSFAQFERELTGERIRDKIAASKAKGMWMGGNVPLGYDPPSDASRALVVNIGEAATVRLIFERFLALGGLFALQKWLNEEGVRSKGWVSTRGRSMGRVRFSRGALRHLLQNRLYVGDIAHKGAIHPGRHKPIVDRTTFDATQAILDFNSRRRRDHVSQADRALLVGLLFDADGQAMTPVFGRGPKKRRYQYYASLPRPRGNLDGEHDDAIRRVPSTVIDELVTRWADKLRDLDGAAATPADVRKLVGRVEIHSSSVHIVIRTAALPGKTGVRATMAKLREHMRPEEQVLSEPAHAGLIRILLPVRLVVRGGRTWLTGQDNRPATVPKQPNLRLVRDLRTGHAILRSCCIDADAIAPNRLAQAPTSARGRRLAQLAFLAPDIQRAILSGQIQAWSAPSVPISWAAQRRLLDAAAPGFSRTMIVVFERKQTRALC